MQPSTPQEHPTGTTESAAARVPAPAGEPHPAEETGAQPSGDGGTAPEDPASAGARAGRDSSVPGQGKRGGTSRGAGSGSRDAASGATATARRGRTPRRPSGRERHDEKITVYVSAEELMDLEHARLVLRGEHGLAVDRGRIVREAVAVVLADLESRGDASILVRRLRGR